MADPLSIVRSSMASFRIPEHHDRVFRTECSFSFDTPESAGGLYVNLSSHQGFGEGYVHVDRQRTGSAVYMHVSEKRVAPPPKDSPEIDVPAPTKFGIGIEGGFSAESKFSIERSVSVVVFLGLPGDKNVFSYAFPDEMGVLPSVVSMVVEALIAHTDVNAAEAQEAWEDKARPSKYADLLEVWLAWARRG